MPVAADQLKAHKLMQFPTVIGGVDIIVNLPGVKANELKLTGRVLADIYLGKITKWNDPEIAALNPGLKLPSTAIAPVHRADGSGTTFVFTDYLWHAEPRVEEQGRLLHQRAAGRVAPAPRAATASPARCTDQGRHRLRRKRLCRAEPPDHGA